MSHDDFQHYRELAVNKLDSVGSKNRDSSLPPEFGITLNGASFNRFKNTQTIASYAVSADSSEADTILLITTDLKDGNWKISKHLTVRPKQLHSVFAALEECVNIAARQKDIPVEQWPPLPELVGEGRDETTSVKVYMELFNGRLEIKLTRTLINGGYLPHWEWTKCGVMDVCDMIRIMLAAYDRISPSIKDEGSCDDPYSIPVPI